MNATPAAALDSVIGRAGSRLLPFLALMVVLAFIDRANAGFANSVLQADTGLGDAAFAVGAALLLTFKSTSTQSASSIGSIISTGSAASPGKRPSH